MRRGVALLLSAILFLQACTAATAPGSFPPQNQFDRAVVEGTIELKVDAGMAQPLVDAEEARHLQEAEVIPVRLVIRNLGTSEVIVESAGMTLKLPDGRVLQAIPAVRLAHRAQLIRLQRRANAAPEMAPVEPPAADKDGPKGIGRGMGEALLKGALQGALAPFFIFGISVAAVTSPIWGPPVLISRYVNKPKQRKAEEEEFRNSRLERLEDVPGFEHRIRVRPGLTGLAQVYAPRDVRRRQKFKYDRLYVDRRSWCLDLRLILLSFWISVLGRWEVRGRKY